jgi:hypothetical protein
VIDRRCACGVRLNRHGNRGRFPAYCAACAAYRMRHRKRATRQCYCGRTVFVTSAKCRQCEIAERRARSTRVFHCACGRRKGPYARICEHCYHASISARAKARYESACQWCGVTFWRKARVGINNLDRDKRLFCTKRCARADRQKLLDAVNAKRRVERRAANASVRDDVIEERCARPCAWCGDPLGDLGVVLLRQFHPACSIAHTRDVRRRNHQPSAHVCPCCGVRFITRFGDARRVWCSLKCHKHMRKLARGLALGRIPVEERNVLAAMMAQAKCATRLWNAWNGGTNATDPQIIEVAQGRRPARDRNRADPPDPKPGGVAIF